MTFTIPKRLLKPRIILTQNLSVLNALLLYLNHQVFFPQFHSSHHAHEKILICFSLAGWCKAKLYSAIFPQFFRFFSTHRFNYNFHNADNVKPFINFFIGTFGMRWMKAYCQLF